MAELVGQLRAQLLRHARMLKHQRALNVAIAVQAGRKYEMPFQQGMIFAKDVEKLVFSHVFAFDLFCKRFFHLRRNDIGGGGGIRSPGNGPPDDQIIRTRANGALRCCRARLVVN